MFRCSAYCSSNRPCASFSFFLMGYAVMPSQNLRDDADTYLMQTYSRQPITIVRGRGSRVYDLEGREYIDFVGGIAVNILGHGHPDLVQTIQRQAVQLIHTSNLYYTEPQVKLAKMLVENSFHGRTLATLTATGQEKVQKGFERLMPGFAYAPFNDFGAVESMVNERTAAILLEPIQ